MQKTFFIFILFSVSALGSSKNLDDKNLRDYLVKKLEQLHKDNPKSESSHKAIALRLAHILSLRAEDQIAKRWSENCRSCMKQGKKDAYRSLKLYGNLNKHLKSHHPVLYNETLFGRSYLHQLLGEKRQAVNHLKEAIKLSDKPRIVARAYFHWGEINYESHEYDKALRAFNHVLNFKQNNLWEYRAYYKKIWALYRLSKYNEAISFLENFLQSSFYTEGANSKKNKELKLKLQEEMVSLYSKSSLTDQQISFLYNFTKDDSVLNTASEKNRRLFDLAISLNRIGRAQESNKVWRLYLTKNIPSLKQMEAHLYIMDNQFILSESSFFENVIEDVRKILSLREKLSSCSEKICQIAKDRIKKILVREKFSNKAVKVKEKLLKLYTYYNKIYPNEFDMLFHSAKLAKNANNYLLSQTLFEQAVQSFKLPSGLNKKEKADLLKDKEKALVLQLEVAELSKDKKRRMQAYEFYSQYGSNSKILFKTEYQKNYLLYEEKQYKKVAHRFKDFALQKISSSLKSDKEIQSLRLKSAHLSLSSLNFLKENDFLMGEWSGLFKKAFLKSKEEFVRIHHTALFNQVRNLLKDKDFSTYPMGVSSDTRLEKAWDILNRVILSEVKNEKEKMEYYMNKLLLAKELFKLNEVKSTSERLLSLSSLTKENRQTVLIWKLWLSEVEFDFKEAFRIFKKLYTSKKSKENLLRLTNLAELADENPFPFYEEFIHAYPQSKESFPLAVRLIEKSSNKKKVLSKYSYLFSKKPDDLTYFVIKTDGGQWNEDYIQSFAKLKFMDRSQLNQFLSRKRFVEKFNKVFHQVHSYALPKEASQRKLIQAIKKYNHLIEQLEQEAKKAIELQDWTSQVVAFSKMSKELDRFYESVLSYAPPKNLTSEEQVQYKALLEKKMNPYKERSKEIKIKLSKLWLQDFILPYEAVYTKNSAFKKFLDWEINQVKQVAPENVVKELDRITSKENDSKVLKTKFANFSKEEVTKIYSQVKKNPFDKRLLSHLLNLEKKRGNKTLSYYIENRLKKLEESSYKKRIKL